MKRLSNFWAVLVSSEDQVLVRRILAYRVPQDIQQLVVDDYNTEVKRRNERARLLGDGEYVTMAQLARQLGVSRSAIFKSPHKYPYVVVQEKKYYKTTL